MGTLRSHTRALLSTFIAGRFGEMSAESTEQATHRALHAAVAHKLIGHIDERYIYACGCRKRAAVAVEAIGLAHTAAHCHAIDGMAQALLRYRNKKRDRRIRASSGITGGNDTQRIGKGTEIGPAAAEQTFDSTLRAQFFFFPEPVFLHNGPLFSIEGILLPNILTSLAAEEKVEGGSHRRSLGIGSLEVDTQTGVGDRLGCSSAESTDFDVILLEVGEILQQRVDALRAEENKHIVVERLVRREIVAHGTVHHSRRAVEFIFSEERHIAAVHVAHGKEILIVLMLEHRWQQIGEFAGLGSEDFALAVHDIFLEIVCHRFRGAEVHQGHRNGDTHFLAQTEEIVDRGLCCENDCGVIADIYFLSAEFLCAQTFHLDKGTEHNVYAVFLCYFVIGRLIGCRLGL